MCDCLCWWADIFAALEIAYGLKCIHVSTKTTKKIPRVLVHKFYAVKLILCIRSVLGSWLKDSGSEIEVAHSSGLPGVKLADLSFGVWVDTMQSNTPSLLLLQSSNRELSSTLVGGGESDAVPIECSYCAHAWTQSGCTIK